MNALARTLEPEVMDSEQEARDYDAMDHAEVNARFCDDLLTVHPRPLRVLDVGTGTALIAIEIGRRVPHAHLDGIDLADAMLARAANNVAHAGLDARIGLARADAKATHLSTGAFDTVISNSLVHHIAEPRTVFAEMWRLVRVGGVLFVRDLARPESSEHVTNLAARYAPVSPSGSHAGSTSDSWASLVRQRDLFVASLHASLTVSEVRACLAPLGIPETAVRMTSDRHWTVAHVRP